MPTYSILTKKILVVILHYLFSCQPPLGIPIALENSSNLHLGIALSLCIRRAKNFPAAT